ncbi:MAG UNVERIFIED_CONTAM: hypothetical protein LVR29_14645 [Microcystis novacekii LVE1205-3]|jgi:dolichol-phosphate mannosyltransferase
MNHQVVDVLNSMPERNRYIRGLRAWIGFQQTAVQFERHPRFAGEVNIVLKNPLRISTYLGLFSGLIALFMAVLVLYWRYSNPTIPLLF